MSDRIDGIHFGPAIRTRKAAVQYILEQNNKACLREMWPHLCDETDDGLVGWNHCHAVDILLKHDARNGQHLEHLMTRKDGGRDQNKTLFNVIKSVLEEAGLPFDGGYVVASHRDLNAFYPERSD